MTILGKDILHQHGPYVAFALLDVAPDIEEWKELPKAIYEGGVFFELSNSLLSCYCGVTRSYSPFDPDRVTLLTEAQQIYEFAAQLLMWEFQIGKIPVFHFAQISELYGLPELQSNADSTPEKLKADLLETLHFIIGQLHQATASGKCVVVAGF